MFINFPQIAAIAAFVANSTEYDLVLLQDLWMRPDHETIRASLPEVPSRRIKTHLFMLQDRVMTRVGDLAPALCDGRVLPTSCSGLAIVSRSNGNGRHKHEDRREWDYPVPSVGKIEGMYS